MNGRPTRSSAEAIALGSQARVISASRKLFVVGTGFAGLPQMSRQMTDEDAVASMVRKYGR